MCTALTYQDHDNNIFGRTMDLPTLNTPWELTYLPSNYHFTRYTDQTKFQSKYAILGGMRQTNGKFLIGDGINAAGLVIAELYLPNLPQYHQQIQPNKINLAPQDVTEWVLANYDSVVSVQADLANWALVASKWYDEAIIHQFHWMLVDQTGTYLIEPTDLKLEIRKLDIPVITNTPQYDDHLHRLAKYINHDSDQNLKTALKKFAGDLPIDPRTPTQRFQYAAIRQAKLQSTSTPDDLNQILQAVKMEHLPGHEDYTHYIGTIDLMSQTYVYHDVDRHQTKTVRLDQLMPLKAPYIFHPRDYKRS